MSFWPSQKGWIHPRKPLTKKQLRKRQKDFENAIEKIEAIEKIDAAEKRELIQKAHEEVEGEIGWI